MRIGTCSFFTGTLAAWLGAVGMAAAQNPAQRIVSEGDMPLTTNGQATLIDLPGSGLGPTTISIAPDGRIWMTLGSGNAIGVINADGSGFRKFDLPNPDSSPRIIALGADTNIWFSEHTGNRMGRITPSGEITEFEIPSEASQPRAIALNSDGNIWAGLFAANKILRITPAGEITQFDIPTPDSGPRALAAGPDGNIWFSEFRAGKIGRITPTGEVAEFDLPRPNAGPGDITAGADGNMWFVELAGMMDGLQPDGNRVGRITMDGEVTEFAMPGEGGSAINISAGPDGNVWYTKGNTLGRVTPDGDIREFPVIESGRTVGISAGADRQPPDRLINRLWFTDPQNDRIGYLSFR